ncbi:MAG: hypothetical protein ACHP84_00195 [Caulobacterales bacterium]
MTRLLAGLGVAAMTLSICGSAQALNPQPLPPLCAAGSHCPPSPGIRCKLPSVATQVRSHSGKRVWKCVAPKVAKPAKPA